MAGLRGSRERVPPDLKTSASSMCAIRRARWCLFGITQFRSGSGLEFTMRFNEYRSAQLNGAAADGYSTNQGMKALEEVFAQTTPPEMGYDYSGMSFQEKRCGKACRRR